jgi:hypothetical protein
VLVFLDVLTTYLCSPDLGLEGNPIAKMIGWTGIITLSSIYILVILFLYCKANMYFNKYYACKNIKQFAGKKQLFFFYVLAILVCAFYIHILNSIFAVLNNLLILIYIKQYSVLNEIARYYNEFYNKLIIIEGNHYYSMFHIVVQLLLAIVGICIAIRKIMKLKKFCTNDMETCLEKE